jgi:hypothetical protein
MLNHAIVIRHRGGRMLLAVIGAALCLTGCQTPGDSFSRIVGTLAAEDGTLLYNCSLNLHATGQQLLDSGGPVGGRFTYTLQNPPSRGPFSLTLDCDGFAHEARMGMYDFGDFSYEDPLDLGVVVFTERHDPN